MAFRVSVMVHALSWDAPLYAYAPVLPLPRACDWVHTHRAPQTVGSHDAARAVAADTLRRVKRLVLELFAVGPVECVCVAAPPLPTEPDDCAVLQYEVRVGDRAIAVVDITVMALDASVQ